MGGSSSNYRRLPTAGIVILFLGDSAGNEYLTSSQVYDAQSGQMSPAAIAQLVPVFTE